MTDSAPDEGLDLGLSVAEARALLSTPEEDLFSLLVPDSEQRELRSFDAVVARGRAIFRSSFIGVRDYVCPLQRKHAASLSDEVQLLSLIAGAIVGQAALAGIPVVPMAALIVKIGLSRLCASWTPDDV